jgi:L-asparaginase/Glu-tRNA(Gln) amidotransferase subunit D
MNVYSTSRDLLDAGVIEARMQSHVAYAKLSWILGRTNKLNEVKREMQTNIVGELIERVEKDTFLI